MAIKRKAHNINWEISVLEAQLGIEPRVKSVKKEAPKNKDPDGKNQSLQANYTDLLLEKLKLKLVSNYINFQSFHILYIVSHKEIGL